MSTHNIDFYEDLTKFSFNYHQIPTLFLLLFIFLFVKNCVVVPMCGLLHHVVTIFHFR